MVSLMVDTTSTILQSWETRTKDQRGDVEIRVDEDLTSLSADIISRACFGSSYSQGEKIFLKLHTLQKIRSKGLIGVPGLRLVQLIKKRNDNISFDTLQRSSNSFIYFMITYVTCFM